MARIKDSIILYTRPDKVWPFIKSKKMMQWRTDISVFELLDEGDADIGQRFFVDKNFRGKTQRFNCVVTDWQENRKISFEGHQDGRMTWKTSFEIVPEAYGCKFIITEKLDDKKVLVFKSFFDRIIIQPALERSIRSSLIRLRDLVLGTYSGGHAFSQNH